MHDSQRHTSSGTAASTTDEALLERFIGGDDTSFTTLYERYESGVLTYLRTVLREHPQVVDDLFQETFVRVFRERQRKSEVEQTDEYRAIQNFRGWIFRVAHNLAISHLRSLRQTISLSDGDSDGAQWDERLMVPIEESFAQIYGSENELASDNLYEQFRACVELLPRSLREVYVLREINGLEYDEVAKIAGCTAEAARMRISRARRTLRKALEKYLGNDE